MAAGRPSLDLTLLSFEHPEGRRLQAAQIDDEPWFVALDLCRLLRLNLMPSLTGIQDDDKIRIPGNYVISDRTRLTDDRDVYFVSEIGFHDLVVRARSQPGGHGARDIRRWITREVLPTVRAMAPASTPRATIPGVETASAQFQRPTRNTTSRTLKRHVLYRFYDQHGALLYIGISWQVATRMQDHKRTAKWWPQVATVRFEHLPDRDAAELAETVAIRSERPRYNIAKVA